MQQSRQRRERNRAKKTPRFGDAPGNPLLAREAHDRPPHVWASRDLPAELWTLVAQYCAACDLPSLAATCTMLYDVARHRAHQDALATYASVDAFVSRWQEATASRDRWLRRARCNCCPWGRRFNWGCLDKDTSTDDDDGDNKDISQDSDDGRASWRLFGVNEIRPPGAANNANEGENDQRHCDDSINVAGLVAPISRRAQTDALPYRRPDAIRYKCYMIDHGTWIVDWLCDACAQKAIDNARESARFHAVDDGSGDAAGFIDGRRRLIVHLVEPVDLDRPHVWSFGGRRRDWLGGHTYLLSAEHLDDDDFVVPAAATYVLDPHALSALWSRQTASAPDVRGYEGFLAGIGSVRGWMPLWGAHEATDKHDTQSIRMLMICCDARHPAWGSVAVVRVNTRPFAMTWYAGEASLECLIARWKTHPMRLASARFAKDWVAWACVFYIDMAAQDEMGRMINRNNEDAAILERMMDEDHALSGKPWSWLLDRGEHGAFFASEDAVDDALDLDDTAHVSQRHVRRRRKCRRRSRRSGAE
ncbi:hypothetical protein pkur_cds_865 [Pandoravirus kuranda]|uniref:F-box domain containing protein n=1 Tax=Pandoravirus kuranda TaxID=3019033 RepID=A0AA95EJH5_9VIRU|nr:hypothetical protein pkur_cds_865 [Pandoravirus kuranda]